MTVRLATPADKMRVIELLRDSRTGAGFDRADGISGFTFPFDPAYAERLLLQHMQSPRALALVYAPNDRAEGVLLAIAHEHPFGPVWIARETLWWIDPAYRGSAAQRMLAAYEKWAAGQGCQFVGMAGMGEAPAVGKLYARRGYKPAETYFLKVA